MMWLICVCVCMWLATVVMKMSRKLVVSHDILNKMNLAAGKLFFSNSAHKLTEIPSKQTKIGKTQATTTILELKPMNSEERSSSSNCIFLFES